MLVFTLFGVNVLCLKAANEIFYMKQFRLGKILIHGVNYACVCKKGGLNVKIV